MTTVLRCFCEFAFAEYRLQKIAARVFAKNPASARVLSKAGFLLEGTLRSDYFRDGVPYDVLRFGLLPAELRLV